MRHTRSHTRNRRSHHALVEGAVVVDKESGALRLPHRIDETTGMYRGKQILPKKEVKAETKKREKRIKEHAHDHDHAEGAKEPMVIEKKETKAKKEGLAGRMTLGKAKSRSGMGGQAGA
jgi:large subunit ribosomal protein L32